MKIFLLSSLILFLISCSSLSGNNALSSKKDVNSASHKKRRLAKIDTVIEGKSDYICTVNFEVPGNKGNYSQTGFSREVFTDGKTYEVIYIHNRKVIETPTSPHPGSIFINFGLPHNEKDEIVGLRIDIGQIDQDGNSHSKFTAEGSHNYKVFVLDYTNKMAVVCFHKSTNPFFDDE